MTVADPHGLSVDVIGRAYSSWMRVPDHADPIRVRWYFVPEDAPIAPPSPYTSSDWDLFRDYDVPLGEISTRRFPFLDWRDGSPPPWPVTVPNGLAVGFASAARSSGRTGQGSGEGVGEAASTPGYTRSLSVLSTGLGLAAAVRVYSRVQEGTGLGVASGSATSHLGPGGLASGLATGSGSAAAGVARVGLGTGTASGLGAAVAVSGRDQSASGTGAGSASTVGRLLMYLTPDQVANLYAWWKADAGAYKDAGVTLCVNLDTVQQWNDQSGNGRNLSQATSGKRPQYQTGIQNSLPGIHYGGAQCLQLASASLSTYAILAVWRGTGTAGLIVEHGPNVTTNDGMSFHTSTNATVVCRKGGTTSSRSLGANWGVQSEFLVACDRYGGFHETHDVYLAEQAQLAPTTTFGQPASGTITDTLNVGSRNNAGGLPFTGEICELIVYTPAPSVRDMRAVVEYLRERWNL